jgi:hypothetical protein
VYCSFTFEEHILLGHVGEKRSACRTLVENREGKRRLTRRWKDNFKMDLTEIRWGMDRIRLA